MAAPAGISGDNPKIVFNSLTLWLPRRFTKWDNSTTYRPVVTTGITYSQVETFPIQYIVKAKMGTFTNDSKVWIEAAASQAFLTAWSTFYDWAGLGKVFSFYRKATDATAGRSYFQYAVWTGKDDGVNLLPGTERYTIDIDFLTEGAAR